MSTRHTPGPWYLAVDDKDIYIGNVPNPHRHNAHTRVDYDDVDHDEAEANARLIAEAPAMLEAIRGIVGVQDNYNLAKTAGVMRGLLDETEMRRKGNEAFAAARAILARVDRGTVA